MDSSATFSVTDLQGVLILGEKREKIRGDGDGDGDGDGETS